MEGLGTELDIDLKGSRNYIHGTDIYNSVSKILCEKNSGFICEIFFKKSSIKKIYLSLDRPQSEALVVAKGRWKHESGFEQGFWVIESLLNISDRYPFDEDIIRQRCRIEGPKLYLKGNTGFSPIENVVACTKFLNTSLYSPSDKQWIFGRLTQDVSFPAKADRLTISVTRSVTGKFSRSRIEMDNCFIGEITFLLGHL